jgi:hypothetical protein
MARESIPKQNIIRCALKDFGVFATKRERWSYYVIFDSHLTFLTSVQNFEPTNQPPNFSTV